MRKLAMFVYGKRIVGSNPTFLVVLCITQNLFLNYEIRF